MLAQVHAHESVDSAPYDAMSSGECRPLRDDLITVSIVSHGHGPMVSRLVRQLEVLPEVETIILTLNVPESLVRDFGPRVRIVENPYAKGFGANHNAAFCFSKTPFFCVLNPDIELLENPFPPLLAAFNGARLGVAAPKITDRIGISQDSMRDFPTLGNLLAKAFVGRSGRIDVNAQGQATPDWVAGMFMLFSAPAFRDISGFDERFFLYYEDVDICARLKVVGYGVAGVGTTTAIHEAQRDSRRKMRFALWHLRSMLRYLFKYRFGLPR